MSHLARLSGSQRLWLAATLVAVVAIVGIGWMLEPQSDVIEDPSLTTDRTIRQIASQLGTTGFTIAKELHLPRNVEKDTALAKLGIEQRQLDEVTQHLLSHQGQTLKYFIFAALSLFGLVWLVRLGRPDGSPNTERKTWYPRAPYLIVLVLAATVCGFALGKSPNPMEGAVKLFKGMVGLQPSMLAVVVAFIFFIALAVVGNKLVCGWACPFGALQELIFSLPILKRVKRKKIPFVASNLIRGGLFALMLLLLFGVVGGNKGFVVYHFMNPFNLFDLQFETPTILLTVVLALGLSLVTYRPYCQLICPFGFVSWLAERFSIARVRVNRDRCNGCGACAVACPLPAAKHMVEGKMFGADCYSCARCLRVCPEEALSYGWTRGGCTSAGHSVSDGQEESAQSATGV